MENVNALYKELVEKLIARDLSITCMESMTGGYIASCITDVPGASGIFKGSYVCYSNEEKCRLGVPKDIIDTFSVYSEETAIAMAEACKKDFHSDIAVGVTGNAGNIDPANKMGVPGKVYVATIFGDDRQAFTLQTDPTLTRGEMKRLVAENTAMGILKMLL